MLRQSSSRNHRSRGLKLKKALQISLLVIVSVWLLYQVKHSYEKKAAYTENDANNDTSDVRKDDQSQGDIVRLGRKGLPAKMEADSSTLDERIEDEDTEEIEQEIKHDEHDDDPIDEPDLDKDDDLPEPGEHSADKDEGSDGVGVFEDEERKERSQEDQEKSFHGDDVSSAVTHETPLQQDELTHHAQEKILYVDDASSAVSNENQEPEHKAEEARKAREKSSRGDNVSGSVDHDAQITKPLPEEQLKSMDRIFEGTANLSNGITFRGPGVNGTNPIEEYGASSTNASSNPNPSTPSMVSESQTEPAIVNLTSNHTGSERSDSTSLKGQHEQQINSAVALDNQTQLSTDLASAELNSPPNGTVALVSSDAQKVTSMDGDSGTSSSQVENKVDGTQKEDLDVSTKIMNTAIGEGEVLPE
ncbi:protein starmaker [Brachypodium distachyon]|uniref:Uncharacterized protein n=1 Tax=Brachypodium distachyon TaxID=15368 RepID=I1GNT2_BRADI|nr:protein starmaker [Brachypodium distachyon]XP_010230615.1 protein starmaker [Brachypodium distachyon]XP_014753212.1 protein starmaker [Brachypodium distachyon]XP_014753213.1 protein starmaker [Brachypodium distachyon]KQK13435.1 hypothetical protein BRADI_1g10120v3 [Brachypodium distachyon]KQK13436.1 hypothetical protein BRADI_1g10120v3 [Brachypodium distachyon]KQK13437.1 hypothetical protein BRADI_1g10120v3 [Brachypodium distachyon]PNT74209.1 hypothetical protein BRADI_1g10120v3 [Brachypo|eukprot:XP_003560394.1 protein starmaker [Brachypodium distachyon]